MTKANHLVGVGPVYIKDIEKHNKVLKDYKKAKTKAAKDFLVEFVKYNEDEIREIYIISTQISGKGDNTLYLAMGSTAQVREIHMRKAEIRDNEINIRDFIPPQIHARYMHLRRACTEVRQRNPGVKAQIRFGEMDLEVWTKVKGDGDPYTKTEMDKITDTDKIPKFNHDIVWKPKEYKPRRRVLSPKPARRQTGSQSPSNGQDRHERPPKITHTLSIGSENSVTAPKKKQREDIHTEDMDQSSSSDDESDEGDDAEMSEEDDEVSQSQDSAKRQQLSQ